MNIRSMNIGSRAGIGFTIIALLVLVMGGIALFQAHQMDDAAAEIRNEWLPAVEAVGEVGSSLGRARALTLRTLILDEKSELNTTVDLVRSINQDVAMSLKGYEKEIDDSEDRQIFENFKTSYEKYLSVQRQILEGVLSSPERADEIKMANGPLADDADQMMVFLNQLIKFNEKGAVYAADQTNKVFNAAVFMIVVALIVILILMIVIAVVLTRSIVSPLAEAVVVADRIADGDLTQRIKINGSDEPAHLLIALKKMQISLHDTIERISESSNMLASASEELHAVTEDTNRGLNQQSAEIDQAATAVNEMTAAVEEVARNAVNTADDSKAADKSTYQGREKVSQALESINKLVGNISDTSSEVKILAQSAGEISQVLVVIRSIAEQTNLLALNAAIEAA
ncbi:methyl-accepting chemotaxis protein, partial [Pseudomonas helleri]|uniref:methyl-accepting chemotaxis protein n=2 Tax=Pseudomonas TaxID=286 RepID=UPI003FD609BE